MRVVYFDCDALRPDHLGCYGYGRGTSPNIDALAEEAVIFTNACCSDSPCLPSRASLFTGRFGIRNGVVSHMGPNARLETPLTSLHFPGLPREAARPGLDPRFFGLAKLLRENGTRTVTVSSFAERHDAWWWLDGWGEVITPSLQRGNEPGEEVNARALRWLEQNGAEENYFLHINYWDAHTTYRMPVSFYEAMSKRPFTAPFSAGEIRRFHDESYGQRSSRFLNPWHYLHGKKRCRVPGVAWPMPDAIATADDLKRFVDGYDASVLHLDSLIGEVLAYFRGRGLMEDTAFIVSADHGDSLGEEGIYGEHGNAAPPTHRIPLIVRWPGRTRGKRAEDALIYGLDLSATLADLAGLKAPAQWDGRSFAALLGKKGKHVERDFLVLSHAVWSAQRACYDGRHWYLRTYHPGTMYLRETSLFDVKSDPFLRNDLSRDKPELCALMESRMEKWVAENRGTRDPLMEEARQGPYSYFSKDDWTGMLRENGLPGDAEKFLKSLEYYETKLLF